MRRTVYFIGLCLVLTIGLYGCGSTTTADSGRPEAQAKSAKASFSVTIPQNATKSLIPSGTSYVYVSWYGYDQTTGAYAPGELYLYPDATGRATGSADLIPGTYNFKASCYSSNDSLLASADSLANVTSGTNNIVISFISGRWTFATPIVLSGNESISSIDISPSLNSFGEYPVTWNISGAAGTQPLTGMMSFMSISGDLSSFAQSMGFPTMGAGTQFDVISFEYNITQGTSYDNWTQGDRVVVATSMGPGDGSSGSSSPDVSSYFNTKLTSGTSMTGTLLEFTYGSFTSVPAVTPTGICDTQQTVFKKSSLRSAALQAAIGSRAIKSAGTAIGTVTFTYTSCEYGTVGGEPFTDGNGNGYYESAEFFDVNGNGIYDEGTDTPYADYNGNGVYDPAEPFVDTNGNGFYDYGTPVFTEVNVTETADNLVVYPFTATASELAQPPLVAKRGAKMR